MPNNAGHVLKIKHLRMRYPRSFGWTLNGFNLNMSSGERVALVGPSGCGKSTVARVILQLLPEGSVCEGELILDGKHLTELGQAGLRSIRGESVGLIFQDPMTRLNPLMTIGDHLLDTLGAHKQEKDLNWRLSKAKELLERVGLSNCRFDAFPHELSGGMRQRLGIALAIALNPPLIIADEPTTSLDVVVADQVMKELTDLCRNLGSALLFISHDLALASRWCERIAILDQGRLVEQGLSKDVLINPKSLMARKLICSARSRTRKNNNKEIDSSITLEVNGLRCWHRLGGWPWDLKWLKAIDDVSFYIHSGETLGLVGSSGCGKSTLCRALLGLIPLRGGEVKLLGQNIFSLNGKALKKARQSLQMVFQDPSACLNPKMAIGEAISDPFLIHKACSAAQARSRMRSLLQQVGLNPPEHFQNRLPRELSGGQQQRVAIARALASKPKVLICDESVSMLDAEIQAEVLDLLRGLQKRLGLSLLFITHDLELASGFCDRVIVLDKGKIIEEGIGNNLLDCPNTNITRKLINACPRLPSISSAD